eukprot:scaffold8471_cov184-Amphora_coffeaeformis.AAC.15
MKFSLAFAFLLTCSEAFGPSPTSFRAQIEASTKSALLLSSTQQANALSSGVEQATAAEVFAGAGPIQLDMNKYNLGLEASADEWTARLSAASAMQDAGAFLDAKNGKSVMVDTLKIAVPRIPGQGLGMELLELAGGREDGLGITIVSGLVEGGCADQTGLLPGDSISKIAVRAADSTEIAALPVECFGYDKTVEAIGSLPPAEEGASVVLTIKRLRRKPKVQLTLQYPAHQDEDDVTLELFAGENLRRAMLTRGVKLNDPLARRFDSGGSGDCGADGTCATCTVNVVEGLELLSPPTTTESQIFKRRPKSWRMACRAIVGYGLQEGNIVLKVNPRQWDDEE